MKIQLIQIAHARSGDKGAHSNVGLMFKSQKLYDWAKSNISISVENPDDIYELYLSASDLAHTILNEEIQRLKNR